MLRRRVVLVLLMALFAPACGMPGFLLVEGPEDGVTVKSLTADLSFGEAPGPVETAAVALFPPAGALLSALPELGDLAGLTFPPPPPLRPASPCPKPEETTFPEKSAGFVVEGQAPAGRFRWRQEGTLEIVGLAKVRLPELDVREIRTGSTTGQTTTYEYETRTLAGAEIQTIEVRQSGNAQTDGVYLRRFRLVRSDASLDFNPPAALAPKLYSLPIRSEVVSANGVDPVSGLTLTINGTVDASRRSRLEGCGEVFDAWAFQGSRVLQSIIEPEQAIRSTTYNTWLAPQYGAIFVGDHVVTRGSFGPFQYSSDIAGTLGSIKPVSRS